MPGIEWVSSLDNSSFVRSMNEMTAQIRQTKSAIEAMGLDASSAMERMNGIGSRLVGTLRDIGAIAGITFSVAQAKSFVDKIEQTRAYFQDIESSMKVFLGSEKAASDFTSKLKDYAYYNMFEFSDLANASKQMIAYKHDVDTIIPRLDQLSNVARGTNAPLMEMVNAYNKAKNLGGLDGRDLQSWAAKGLIVKDILKEMGETVQGNRVSFEQLNKVLDKVTGEGGMFHNLMGEQMNNISAEQGQLEDTLASMYNELGEKYQDTIVKWYKMNSEIAENFVDNTSVIMDAGAGAADFLIEHYQEIGSVMLRLIAVYGEWRATMIAMNAIRGAQQWFLKETEIDLLDEAIKKEKKGYEDLLSLKEKAKNADLAESVAKGELTEKQAALIAAKRNELEQIQVSKETIDIDRQINELKSRELELDLQDKVASDQLTVAQAQEIQQRRDMLRSLEEEIRKRRELAMAGSEKSINEIDAQIRGIKGEGTDDNQKKDYYDKKLQKMDGLIEKAKEEGAEESYISYLEEKRNGILEKRDVVEERIHARNEKMKGLEEQRLELSRQNEEIIMRYGDKDEKLDILRQRLEDAKEEESQAKKAYDNVRKHREEEEGTLRLMKEKLEKQKEINRASEGGNGYSDLSELNEQVKQQQEYVDTLNNSINKRKEDALAMGVQEAAEKRKNIQTKIDNIQTGTNVTQTNLKVNATAKEIMAMKGLTAAEKIHLISLSSSTTATQIFRVATIQLKEAVKGLGTAIKTNPLGIFIGAITMALPWLMEWVGGTDDATEAEQKYGNEAKEAESKVKSLVSTITTADKSSKLYKDSVAELERTYSEYGIEISKVKDEQGKEITNVQELTDRHGELLDVLRQEAIERQRNNDREEAADEYKKASEKAAKELTDSLSDDIFSKYDKNAMKNLIDEDAIKRIAEEREKLKKIGKEVMAGNALPEEEIRQREKYNAAVEASTKVAMEYASSITQDGKALNNTEEALARYVMSLAFHKVEQDEANERADRAAEKAMKLSDAQNEAARKLRLARMSVTELKEELKKLAEQRNIPIDVNITYNEMNPMPAVLRGYTSDQWKKRQAVYLNLAQKHQKGAYIYDKATGQTSYMTGRQLMEESLRSGNQSASVKSQEDAAKAAEEKRKEEAERNAEKAADKRKRDAEKAATEEANRKHKLADIERRETERLEKQRIATENAMAEARIAEIRDDGERERAERENQYRLTMQKIREKEKDYRKQNLEIIAQRWEANNKNKNLNFTDTQEYKDYMSGKSVVPLTEDQSAEIMAEERKVNAERARLLEDTQEKERLSLYGYIKEYGGIQQQKAAIAAEYDMKIAKEGDAIQKAALEKQKQRLLSDLTFKEWQQSIDWEAVFNDLNRQSSSALEELKAKLREMLKADGITAENAKVLAEKIRETEDLLSRRKNPIAAWLPGLRERIRLTNDAKAAEDELTAATERQNRLWKLSMADISVLQQKIRTSAGREVGVQELSSMSADEYVKVLNLDPLGDAAKAARDEFNRLITSTIDLGKAQGDYLKAQENARKRREALDRFTSGGSIAQYFKDITAGLDFAGWANLIGTNIKSMSELVDRIGLGETEFGKSVHDFADGVGGFQSALQSLQNGDVIGAVNGIIGGFEGLGRSFGRAFGITVDADYSSYNRLVEQYDGLIGVWDELIDRKSEYIGMSYGAETLKVGKEALDLIEKQAAAYRELGKERLNAGSSAGSSSIGRRISKNMDAQDWKGIADSLGWSVDEAKEFIGTTRMTGLFDLTAEQIKALQEGNQVWWAKLDDDVRKYLESIIENEEKWSAAHSQMMQQLTTTTEENVFSGFLDDLYGIADGSEEVFDNIAESWQQMVNRMVINNLIGAKFQERLKDWYTRLADVNERMTNGKMTEDEYKDALDNLQAEYEREFKKAQADVEHFRDAGIIKASDEVKANEDKNATNVVSDKATYEQFETYLGIATAQQIALEQIRSILMKWDGGNMAMDAVPSEGSGLTYEAPQRDLSWTAEYGRMIADYILSLKDLASWRGQLVTEIRNLIMTSNEHLIDIRKSNREILSAMTERVDNLYNLMEKKL